MKRLPFILIAMFIVASCKMKEHGATEAKPDPDTEAVTDTDFCFKMDGKLPATPLFNDLTGLSGNLVGISINLCKSIQKELFINDTS